MKQGSSTIDANALASGRGLSSGSPSVAPVWSSPTTVKTSVGSTGSYIPSYTSWYPTAHQESMQQSQLMWGKTSALDSAADGALTLWGRSQALSTDGTQQQQQPRRFAAVNWHIGFISEDKNQGRDWKKLQRRAMRPRATCPWHSAEAVDKWILYWLLFISILSSFCFRFNVIAFWGFFLFLPHHPFVMRRPVWRWPEISPRLFTVQREEKVCVCIGGRGSLNQISGLQIPSSGCWNHSAHCARPQPALLFICSLFVI